MAGPGSRSNESVRVVTRDYEPNGTCGWLGIPPKTWYSSTNPSLTKKLDGGITDTHQLAMKLVTTLPSVEGTPGRFCRLIPFMDIFLIAPKYARVTSNLRISSIGSKIDCFPLWINWSRAERELL